MALHHSFPDDYELPYPQEYDYLWTEERYSKLDGSVITAVTIMQTSVEVGTPISL